MQLNQSLYVTGLPLFSRIIPKQELLSDFLIELYKKRVYFVWLEPKIGIEKGIKDFIRNHLSLNCLDASK